MYPKIKQFIGKLILQTKEGKLIWHKLSCQRTYNINFSTKINNVPVILLAKRADDFFSIEHLNLFIPDRAPITSSYDELYPLLSEIIGQNKSISPELYAWFDEYIKS